MQQKIDWSSLWKTEDWWSCWIGWFILLLVILRVAPHAPKISKWTTSLAAAFPKGIETIWITLAFLAFILVLTLISNAVRKRPIGLFIPGFITLFALSFLSILISKQKGVHYWGFEYVIFALIFGLFISNVLRVPGWLKPAVMTEYYIKIGLVCMGATILFTVIAKAGPIGIGQALLVVVGVWFFAYWLGRRFGLDEKFCSVIATGVSICGVSASIAAGGAVRGDPKQVSYVVAWLMICAVVLILVMPPIAKALHLPENWAGAWIGGVIDNTGAVVAAGAIVGKTAETAAALVKMAQNVLIGIAAFLLAIWATVVVERVPGAPRPSFMEIWYRFPKFVVGFVVSSIIMTLLVMPVVDPATFKAMKGLINAYKVWFFSLCFVCIGLETRVKDLITVGGGKPAIVYWLAQLMNIIWTMIITYFLWSGTFFTPPL